MGGWGDISPQLALLLEKFPQHKSRELIGKMNNTMGLSV